MRNEREILLVWAEKWTKDSLIIQGKSMVKVVSMGTWEADFISLR